MFFCKYFNFLLEIVRINKKVSNVRAKFDVWSLMYTTDTSVDSFLTAAAPLPVIQTFYSRFLTSFFSKFHYCDIEGNLPVMVYDYTAMIIILVLDFFAYKKEKYWTKLFSNVQQRLSYSSCSNSWLLQMSCTTILSVSTMKPKPLWILICILNTISPEKFKNVMVRLLGIWNNCDARVYSFNTSTKFCPLLTTTNLWVNIFTLKVN